MGGLLKTHPWLAWMFFIAALSLAGIPPLSGFFSKFALILESFLEGRYIIAAVALLVGLLTLFSMLKIFVFAFWGSQKHSEEDAKKNDRKIALANGSARCLDHYSCFAAEPMLNYSLLVAEQIFDPSIYIESVLKE